VCSNGDLTLARAAGRHGAFQDVNRFFKWMLRLTGPAALFTRAASVWNNYHSAGRYVFEGAQGNRAAIRIDDWEGADPVMCKRIEGWIERALEMTLGAAARPQRPRGGAPPHRPRSLSPSLLSVRGGVRS
jgi:hypothetical protein